jgi:hypothetical protein
VAALPEAVAALVAPNGKGAVNALIEYCGEHGIAWRRLSGDACGEMGGQMHELASDPAPVRGDGSEFASPGSLRDLLVEALAGDLGREKYGLQVAAERLARIVHASQVDKGGEPYAGHPRRVSRKVMFGDGPEEAVAAAWLHDTIEDTWVTADFLAEVGFPQPVIRAVEAVTKQPGESTDSYAQRVAANPLAVIVKRADLADNTDPRRLKGLDEAARTRLEVKYAVFAKALDEAVGSGETGE